MFSPSQAFKFTAPMPPIPMPAIFSLLLGASLPSTRLGTMAADSAARADALANCLRERARVFSWLMAGRSYVSGRAGASGTRGWLRSLDSPGRGRPAEGAQAQDRGGTPPVARGGLRQR